MHYLHELEYCLVVAVIFEVIAVNVGPTKNPTSLDELTDALFNETRTGRDLIGAQFFETVRMGQHGTATSRQRRCQQFHLTAR